MFDIKKVFKSVRPSSPGSRVPSSWQQIESFYKTLAEGLRTLESSLLPDSLSFRVEWLQLAVTFLHGVQSSTFTLVEKLGLPVRSKSLAQAPDFLNEYLDVSMSLLDMCNNLRTGLSELESYHGSLDLALKRLTSAAEALQPKGRGLGEVDSSEASNFLKPLNEARKELDRLESDTFTSSMWVGGFIANKISSPANKVVTAVSTDLSRSVSLQLSTTTSPGKKKKRDVSLLLYDVQVVTGFVSCILLWVLTGQSGEEEFSSEVGVFEPSSQLQRATSWPAFMFRLKGKVSEYFFQDLQNSSSRMKLQDVKNFQRSLSSLRAELEAGLKDGKLGQGTAFADRIKTLLGQQKQKLAELGASLERISTQLNDMFTEIMGRRKKVLDTFERSLYHQPSF